MKPLNHKILVSVNIKQKSRMKVGEVEIMTAGIFDANGRYKNPTVAQVVTGNRFLKEGDVLLCHHNLFATPSPYQVQDGLFSVPFSSVLFAKIDKEGVIEPICGNLICKRIPCKNNEHLPVELQKTEDKIYEVVNSGWEKDYQKGDIIGTRTHAGYDIIYLVNGIEHTVTKVESSQICGILKREP